jgi:hypothetical protein
VTTICPLVIHLTVYLSSLLEEWVHYDWLDNGGDIYRMIGPGIAPGAAGRQGENSLLFRGHAARYAVADRPI